MNEIYPQSRHRIGKFRIGFERVGRSPEEALAILSGLLVVRAESRWDMNAIEYIAIGDCFDEIDRGFEAPEYVAVLTKSKDGRIKLEGWQRV